MLLFSIQTLSLTFNLISGACWLPVMAFSCEFVTFVRGKHDEIHFTR